MTTVSGIATNNVTPKNNSPQNYDAPTLFMVSTAFTDEYGQIVTVDSDVYVDIHVVGDNVPFLSGIDINTGLKIKQSPAGALYYTSVNITNVQGFIIESRWYAKRSGVNHSPYPVVKTHGISSNTETNILLYDEVKYHILHKLGWPSIQVELEVEHISTAVNSALDLYNKWLPRYKKISVGDVRESKTKYIISEYGRGVVKVDFVRKQNARLLSDTLFGRSYPSSSPLDFPQYIIGDAYNKMLRTVTSEEPDWDWDDNEPNALFIYVPNSDYFVDYTVSTNHRLEDIPSQYHELFKELCVTYSKGILGRIRVKYGDSISTPDGEKQLDGGRLLEEYNQEMERNIETLRSISRVVAPKRG